MPTVNIEGFITPITPFHSAAINQKGMVNDRGQVTLITGNQTAKIPCVPTAYLPLPHRDENADRSRTVRVPVFPGSSLRGYIRNEAIKVVFEALAASGETVSRTLYFLMTKGTAGANTLDSTPLSPAEIDRARENLVVGLFGGGPRQFDAYGFRTDSCMAVTKELIDLDLVPPWIPEAIKQAALPGWQTTYAHAFITRDPFLQDQDLSHARQVVKDFEKVFHEWQEQVLANSKDRHAARTGEDAEAADKKTSKSSISNQAAVEAVIPGIAMTFNVEVSGSEAQIGLVIRALENAFAAGRFGGYVRNFFGMFAPSLTLRVDGGKAKDLLTGDGRTAPTLHPAAKPFMKALDSHLPTLRAEDIEAAYSAPQLA